MNLLRKSKNLLKPKRKGDNSEHGSVTGDSSTQAESAQKAQSHDVASQVKATSPPERSSEDIGLTEDALEALKVKSEEETMEEINVKVVQLYTAPTAEIVEEGHPNPRIQAAKTKLFEASNSLSETLADYSRGRKDTDPAGSILFISKLGETGQAVTPDQLVAAVEAMVLDQEKQKPTIASKLGNAIGKIYPLASLTLGVGSTIAESSSFAPVKGAVNGLCLLLTLADQEQSRAGDFLKQVDRISYQALRMAEIQKHHAADINDLLLEKSTNLMTEILLFFRSAVMFFRHDYFYNLGKTILLGPKLYSDAKSALDIAINDYDQALLLQVTIKMFSMGNQPTLPENAGQTTNKTSELVSWLKSSHWEAEKELLLNCQDRAYGTMKWVLQAEAFKIWRLSDKRSRSTRSLWLNGLPGVGKSTIAAYITQILQAQHPDSAVLYFFCKAGDPSLDSVTQLIRTLASQMVQQIPAARSAIQKLKDDDFKDSGAVSFMLQKLIGDSLSGVVQDVFIVVDGLDECEGINKKDVDNETAVKRLLSGLLGLDVKLLVSSRPTPEISRALSETKKREVTYDDSREDIQSYVSMRVTGSKTLENGFKSMSKAPSDFIAEKSQGNFLWVRIVLDILKETSTLKDFQNVIDTIPKDLGDVYDQLLTKLESAGSLDLALVVLRFVLFSVRALTVDELEIATGILVGGISDLREFIELHCGSFLRILPGKAGLYIVHETFRSYITNPESAKGRCLQPGSSHARLAVACLGCLLEPGNTKLERFRDYAVGHWLDHLSDFLWEPGALDITADIAPLLAKTHEFFASTEALRTWMKQYAFSNSEKYNIGARMVNMHDLVVDFLNYDPDGVFDKSLLAQDLELRKALDWRKSSMTGKDFAKDVYLNFTYVWINTNWREKETAEYMLRGAWNIWTILHPFQKSTLRLERNFNLKGLDGKTLPRQRGWKFYYDAEPFHRLTLSELETLANTVDFNAKIGVQAGNYAFGELEAESEHCIKNFQNALDEHPECWHLHEGLGKGYEDHDQREKAIKCYAEAIKVHPTKQPSVAYDHWRLVSAIKEENGDLGGAIEALKTGASTAPDSEAYRYWDTMSKLHEKTGNGNAMVELYKEAIKNHPGACNYFWKALAKVYSQAGAKELQFNAYRDAIKVDPENADEYGELIRTLASQIKDLCIWQPVEYMLDLGPKIDPTNAHKYYHEKGLMHMCRRQWKEAVEKLGEYARLTENNSIYEHIGNAYLGLGETSLALAAYQQASDDPSNSWLAGTVADVHIIDGNYTQAIRIFKSAQNGVAARTEKSSPSLFQNFDDVGPQLRFECHRNLGLCYEAVDREDDMKAELEAAIECYKDTALKLDEKKDRTIFRHEARALFEVALVLEKLGRKQEAEPLLLRAVELFEITTLDTDDEVQESEAKEAAAALSRVTSKDSEPGPIPDLKEKIGEMRLQRRLALKYTTDWYCFQHWKPPRKRGGMSWGKVSYVNKFKINNGERTYIMPWGFGHGE